MKFFKLYVRTCPAVYYNSKILNSIGALFFTTGRGVLEERFFFIGNFVGVYLKQELDCVKKCLGQLAEEQREDRAIFCQRRLLRY